MMTPKFSLLKELLEAQVRPFDKAEDATMAELANTAMKKCSKAIDSYLSGGPILYRGWINDMPPNGVYNPGTGIRKSENTSNWYTKFFDTNPANSEFPARSRSFICTDSEFVATEFSGEGTTLIFPFDGVEIGVIPDRDLWDIEIKTSNDSFGYDELNSIISELSQTLGEGWDDWDEFIGTIETLSPPDMEVIKKTLRRLGLHDLSPEKAHTELVNFVEKVYSLKTMGCKVVTDVRDIAGHGGINAHEVWFSGRCVVINLNDEDEFKAFLSLNKRGEN